MTLIDPVARIPSWNLKLAEDERLRRTAVLEFEWDEAKREIRKGIIRLCVAGVVLVSVAVLCALIF